MDSVDHFLKGLEHQLEVWKHVPEVNREGIFRLANELPKDLRTSIFMSGFMVLEELRRGHIVVGKLHVDKANV